MTQIMVRCLSKKAQNSLFHMASGPTSHNFLVSKIDGKTFIFKNNGIILSYLTNLKKRYGLDVQIYAIDRIEEFDIPDPCRKAGGWMAQNTGRKLEDAIKNAGVSREVLEKCKINYSKDLK